MTLLAHVGWLPVEEALLAAPALVAAAAVLLARLRGDLRVSHSGEHRVRRRVRDG